MKARSIGASLLQDRSTSESAGDSKVNELVQRFASLLADLDLEHAT